MLLPTTNTIQPSHNSCSTRFWKTKEANAALSGFSNRNFVSFVLVYTTAFLFLGTLECWRDGQKRHPVDSKLAHTKAIWTNNTEWPGASICTCLTTTKGKQNTDDPTEKKKTHTTPLYQSTTLSTMSGRCRYVHLAVLLTENVKNSRCCFRTLKGTWVQGW